MESMSGYALPHGLAGEEQRLALMSTLLDPFEFACIERLGVGQGCRCLEFGCGNGSISLALAERVAPTGLVIASDIDLSYVSRLKRPCLQVRHIASQAHTANFNGRSDWANYWIATIRELQPFLLKGGYITTALLKEFETCYRDPHSSCRLRGRYNHGTRKLSLLTPPPTSGKP
jgi:hypothetical protein